MKTFIQVAWSNLIFLFLTMLLIVLARGAFAAPGQAQPSVKSKTAETRKASEKVSASLLKKLRAQALLEARAEIAREQAAREQARLEALQELDAIAEPIGDESDVE